MRLTQFSNFAIRVLMYAALKGPTPSAVPEMARAYGISYDHLKKVAAELCLPAISRPCADEPVAFAWQSRRRRSALAKSFA